MLKQIFGFCFVTFFIYPNSGYSYAAKIESKQDRGDRSQQRTLGIVTETKISQFFSDNMYWYPDGLYKRIDDSNYPDYILIRGGTIYFSVNDGKSWTESSLNTSSPFAESAIRELMSNYQRVK
ncbi:MAG: hypothetical protein ACKPCM_19380 [Pseudanabaena sp.]